MTEPDPNIVQADTPAIPEDTQPWMSKVFSYADPGQGGGMGDEITKSTPDTQYEASEGGGYASLADPAWYADPVNFVQVEGALIKAGVSKAGRAAIKDLLSKNSSLRLGEEWGGKNLASDFITPKGGPFTAQNIANPAEAAAASAGKRGIEDMLPGQELKDIYGAGVWTVGKLKAALQKIGLMGDRAGKVADTIAEATLNKPIVTTAAASWVDRNPLMRLDMSDRGAQKPAAAAAIPANPEDEAKTKRVQKLDEVIKKQQPVAAPAAGGGHPLGPPPPLMEGETPEQRRAGVIKEIYNQVKELTGRDLTKPPDYERILADAKTRADAEFNSQYARYGDNGIFPDWLKNVYEEMKNRHLSQAEARYKTEMIGFNKAGEAYTAAVASYDKHHEPFHMKEGDQVMALGYPSQVAKHQPKQATIAGGGVEAYPKTDSQGNIIGMDKVTAPAKATNTAAERKANRDDLDREFAGEALSKFQQMGEIYERAESDPTMMAKLDPLTKFYGQIAKQEKAFGYTAHSLAQLASTKNLDILPLLSGYSTDGKQTGRAADYVNRLHHVNPEVTRPNESRGASGPIAPQAINATQTRSPVADGVWVKDKPKPGDMTKYAKDMSGRPDMTRVLQVIHAGQQAIPGQVT